MAPTVDCAIRWLCAFHRIDSAQTVTVVAGPGPRRAAGFPGARAAAGPRRERPAGVVMIHSFIHSFGHAPSRAPPAPERKGPTPRPDLTPTRRPDPDPATNDPARPGPDPVRPDPRPGPPPPPPPPPGRPPTSCPTSNIRFRGFAYSAKRSFTPFFLRFRSVFFSLFYVGSILSSNTTSDRPSSEAALL